MLKKDSNYRRLKLGGRGWLGQSSYWIGPNHLLVVEVSNYVEKYRRFYFRDVQAIIIQQTNVRLWYNILLGFLLFVALAVCLSVAYDQSANGFAVGESMVTGACLALGLVFATFMLVNTLRGPTCSVFLRTAVQTQKLAGVSRWRKADGLFAALDPLITAAQPPLSPEDVAERLPAADALSMPVTGGPGLSTTPASRPPALASPRHYQGKAHLVLFWLLLADTPFTLLDTILDTTWTSTMGLLLLAVSVGFAIAALVRQNRTDLPRFLKVVPWLVLGLVAGFIILLVGIGFDSAIRPNSSVGSSEESMTMVTMAMTVTSTAVNFVLGFLGLVQLRRFHADYARDNVPPPLVEPPTD